MWRTAARGLGGVVRAIGRGAASARDIDPTHRRDGLALLLVALAVVSGLGIFSTGAGPVGELIDNAVRGWIGVLAGVFPRRPEAGEAARRAGTPSDRREAAERIGAAARTLAIDQLALANDRQLGERRKGRDLRWIDRRQAPRLSRARRLRVGYVGRQGFEQGGLTFARIAPLLRVERGSDATRTKARARSGR